MAEEIIRHLPSPSPARGDAVLSPTAGGDGASDANRLLKTYFKAIAKILENYNAAFGSEAIDLAAVEDYLFILNNFMLEREAEAGGSGRPGILALAHQDSVALTSDAGKSARRGSAGSGARGQTPRGSAGTGADAGLRARLDSMHQVDWQKRAEVLTT